MEDRDWYSPDPRFWWWGVLAIYFAAFAAGLLAAPPEGPLDYVLAALAVWPLVGMVGYLLQRRIAWRVAWVVCFWVQVVSAVTVALLVASIAVQSGALGALLALMLSALIYFPVLVFLWAYAYRSREIWIA
jgi:hypothetical protein